MNIKSIIAFAAFAAASVALAQDKPATAPAPETKPAQAAPAAAVEYCVFRTTKGDIVMELDRAKAPVTVENFVGYVKDGFYDGTVFHRIVPNFVIQGGSPGADEYDPATSFFMRDEVGFARNARGTFGISTRGRDTGDGQLYINLIDNVRLDHDYTVFAETTRGLDVVDRVQEGDVIEAVVIRRARR
jgi:cyclophilin family peptidyl-prolyl cis-trans isomerase